MGLRLAANIFFAFDTHGPWAILALLPGTDAVFDQGELNAASDGGADAVSDQVDVCAASDGGADVVSDQDNQPSVRALRMRRRRKDNRKKKFKQDLKWRSESKVQLRMKAQVLQFNNSGAARTYDHLMPVPQAGPATRKRKASGQAGAAVAEVTRGKGRYKSSTPEYIGKMAFSATDMSLRALTKDGGGGHMHAGNCSLFLASCIDSHEQAEARRRNVESRQGEPFDFYITNNMHDETRLYLSGFGRATKRQRVLAASGQVTWKPAGGLVQDADVFRSPAVLRNYTAAHCATVVADPLDPTSLYPGPNENRPLAKYRGSLQATDQHSVNVLMEKVIVQRQDDFDDGTSFELTCFCVQHKTGNVVEEVTKFLGLLSPSFCIASCLSQGDLGEAVDTK